MVHPERLRPPYKTLVENVAQGLKEREEPIVEEKRRRLPLLEQIDLAAIFLGNGEPEVFLTLPFVRIARLIVLHTWDGTTLNYNAFAKGTVSGDTLDTPLRLSWGLRGREKEIIPGGIDASKDYMRVAFDTDVVIDTLGVSKQVYFTARFSFRKFMGLTEGLNMVNRRLSVHGPVDGDQPVSDFGNDFIWTFEGWGWDR